MSNSNTNPKQTLGDYLLNSLKIKPVKTKSGKGFMIYQVSKVTDLQHLTSLVEDCNWKLIKSDERYLPNGTKQPSTIYIGHADSKLDMNSVDDFVSID